MWRSRTALRRHLALVLGAALALGASEGAPITPAEELRRLEETGLQQAREVVLKDEITTPFAFVVRSDGRSQRLAPRIPRGLRRADKIVASLMDGLRSQAQAGAYRAVAVFRFVIITLPGGGESKAVHAGLEREAGRCVEIFLPYAETDEGETHFEAALRRSRRPQIFAHCEPLESTTR